MSAKFTVNTVSLKSPQAGKLFIESIKTTGFAVLTDHPIPAELIQNTYKEWDLYFKSSEKHEHVFAKETQTGYFPFRAENAKGYSKKDLKEFYHHYPFRKQLPLSVSEFTPSYYERTFALGKALLKLLHDELPSEIKSQLSEPLDEMVDRSEETLLRVLHYPPLTGEEEVGAVRAAAHEDINLITLLPTATASGLQALDLDGNWHDVPCDSGMIVINSGDMLREATHGYLPSTTHRVINPLGAAKGTSRYSMPMFMHPRKSVKLSDRYTAEGYLNERLREIGLK